MPQILKAPAGDAHPSANEEVRRTVASMLERIERCGIDAIREFSRTLDGWDPESFRVDPEQIEAATASIHPELAGQIDFALEQVRGFALAQRQTLSDLRLETLPGVVLGHRFVPVGSVGAYIPGGRYPLIAAAFMTVGVPRVAGVERIVAVAPPQAGGGIHPVALHAITRSGADEVHCIGGVQALAMMAFGLGDVEPVDMLVGPGNAYVAEAKRQLFGQVGIDLIAGPSEILVIAGPDADASTVALDLLAQAEHGPTSRAVLVTWCEELAHAVLAQIDELLPALRTAGTARAAWHAHGEVVLVAARDDALLLADAIALEHVHVQTDADDQAFFARALRNYGSLFLGADTTVVFGDKAIGTNHCLPTGGAARYTGGLWVGTFLKALSFQEVTAEGAARVAPAAAAIAGAEQLDGHARSAALRGRAGTLARERGGLVSRCYA